MHHNVPGTVDTVEVSGIQRREPVANRCINWVRTVKCGSSVHTATKTETYRTFGGEMM